MLLALEKMNAISRALQMAVDGGPDFFFAVFPLCFSDSVHPDVESWLPADFLGALDGQQSGELESPGVILPNDLARVVCMRIHS